MSVTDSLFVTEFLEDGSHNPMTLPEYASRFLVDIEAMFGPRDRSFTLVGIDIDRTPGKSPHLWYPDTGIPPSDTEGRSKHVVIRLGPAAFGDPARARWQLAHECFHLLDPWSATVDGRPASWLEEGLAAWYQNSRVPEAEWHEGAYALAEDLVGPLAGVLSQAVKRIRTEQRLRISEFTPDVLVRYCPRLGEETLQKLCGPFSLLAGEVQP